MSLDQGLNDLKTKGNRRKVSCEGSSAGREWHVWDKAGASTCADTGGAGERQGGSGQGPLPGGHGKEVTGACGEHWAGAAPSVLGGLSWLPGGAAVEAGLGEDGEWVLWGAMLVDWVQGVSTTGCECRAEGWRSDICPEQLGGESVEDTCQAGLGNSPTGVDEGSCQHSPNTMTDKEPLGLPRLDRPRDGGWGGSKGPGAARGQRGFGRGGRSRMAKENRSSWGPAFGIWQEGVWGHRVRVRVRLSGAAQAGPLPSAQ